MNSTCVLISRVILGSWANSKLLTLFCDRINIAIVVQFLPKQPRSADYTEKKADLDMITGPTPDQGKPMVSKHTQKK